MIDGAKMKAALESVGYYISGPGGAEYPATIASGHLLFELITEGAVYAPEGEVLHGPGAVFVHSAGQTTVSRSPGDGYYACMFAQFRIPPARNGFVWPRIFQWTEVPEVLRFSQEAVFAFHHTGGDRAVLGDWIWSQLRFRHEEFRRRAARQAIPPSVAETISHLDRHYAEPLGIGDLAARCGLSVSHLHAQFRAHTGMSPHQHLILQRMRSARHQLVTTREPIKSIARNVGYANTENFCRAFKKHSGLTAAAYRRKFLPYG